MAIAWVAAAAAHCHWVAAAAGLGLGVGGEIVCTPPAVACDDNDEILETQYFSVSGIMNKNTETNIFMESDITDRLRIVTQQLETTQLVLGFMLDKKKRNLIN